jgi:AraC-like DNA-binding protein
VILAGNGRRHYVREFPGPLSIKSVIRGRGTWTVNRSRFEVDADSVLVLNNRQHYTILIDAPQPVQTFCLFFKTGLVEQAWRCHTAGASELLDDPGRLPEAVGFFERMHPKTGPMAQRIEQMHREVISGRATPESLDDGFLLAARELLCFRSELLQAVARVPAMRSSTKAELFRRLTVARSMIEGSLDQALPLDRIAETACLSPYHLHRLFGQVFGETPHRYAVRRRLERARRLLAQTDMPVTMVCLESGFQSLGSFSALFRKETGSSPQQFRMNASRPVKVAAPPTPLNRV